jgi:eukaryotic-like serine/threonine-protein kinase
MSADKPDGERTQDTDFAAMWSSEGATRSFSPSATGSGLPADLPFLFAPGQRFGPYLIVRPLGKGGMGQVYEAEETESGRRIAMKILSRGLGDDEERERFLREGRLAASLSHPNTVYVFGTTEVQGFPVIAMELAPGGTLKELLVGGTPLAPAQAIDAILQVVAGLDAAAAIGILHRDIKPSNCFVHDDGRILVGDFGLSVATSKRGTSATSPGAILGTPGFASPEQLRGESLDVRSDIYSVGATIFYLLSGRAPFDDQSTTSLMARVATEPPPSLTTLRPELPRRLALVVARCLAKTPGERFPGYPALAAALAPFSSARLEPAPLFRRLLAGWIDLYAAALPMIALERYFAYQPLSASHPGEAVLLGLTALIVMTLYYGLFEGGLGATPGKALFGLRVVDASNGPPGISGGITRALAFGAPLQIVTRTVLWLILRSWPEVAVGSIGKIIGGVSLAVLFSTARRSNGWSGLHDRATSTRVVLKRTSVEARQRHDRIAGETVLAAPGEMRIGPYLVPDGTALLVTTPVSIEAHDDRLGRRVWIDLLPPGTPALGARRRDLGRPGRARWLAGRRNGDECWDAYEAIEGEPIQQAAARPQPWSRVRHWLADLAREVAAGLDEGSLPPLHARRVWIDRDDRGRILDWTDPGSGQATLDPDAAPADLPSAQRLLYACAVGALLGIAPDAARDRTPETPLPIPARKLLLSLRDASFPSTAALLDGIAAVVAVPAVFPKGRRAVQIGVCALPPVLASVAGVGALLYARGQNMLSGVESSISLWAVALAVASGMFFLSVAFALPGAFLARGGLTLRAFGAALVNRRGEPASRFRALWRAMVTWSLACALPIFFKANQKGTNIDTQSLILQSVVMALFIAGAVWTALHPSRSIQDRLAGTWIVPRG